MKRKSKEQVTWIQKNTMSALEVDTEAIGVNKILFLLFFWFPFLAGSQCLKMQEIVDMFDNNFSFDYSSLSNNGYQNSLMLDGLPFTYSIQAYSSINGDQVLVESSDLVMLTTTAGCFSKIKAAVAKQAGSLVSAKTISSTNGYNIEHYEHSTQDMIIEFHKLESEEKYTICLMSANMSQNIKSLIDKKIQQQKVEQYLTSKLDEVKLYIASNELNNAENYLREAKNYADRLEASSSFYGEIQSLETQLVALKFKLFNIDFLSLLNSNKFLSAKTLIERFPNTTDSFYKKQLLQMKSDLKTKAVGYYSSKSSNEKTSRNYPLAITYLDSLLMFDYENKLASNERNELISINAFLKERKTKIFNFWESNNYVKENLFREYKSKCYSLINDADGHFAFTINIISDTNCVIKPKIEWTTAPSDHIIFSDNELNRYSAKPYQKYGFCANSVGSLSFDINWSSTHYKLFWVDGSVIKNSGVSSTLDNYLSQKYPLVNGRFNYSKSNVSFNGESSEKIQITDFKTRGPVNAIFSLVVPGSGTFLVTYGRKGYKPLGLFLAGATCLLIGGTNELILTGALCLTTAYIWDFTSALYLGSRNVIRAKEIRRTLRADSIKL